MITSSVGVCVIASKGALRLAGVSEVELIMMLRMLHIVPYHM